MVGSDIICHGVRISEVGRCLSLSLGPRRHVLFEQGEDLHGMGSLEPLVVVSLVVITTIQSPVLFNDLLNADQLAISLVFIDRGENLQPAKDSPDAIFLTNVAASSAERLLSTD